MPAGLPRGFSLSCVDCGNQCLSLLLQHLAWSICALRLYSPEEAGSQWSPQAVARLLQRLMLDIVGTSVPGKSASFFLVRPATVGEWGSKKKGQKKQDRGRD